MKFLLIPFLLTFSASTLPTFDWEKSIQKLETFNLEISTIEGKEITILMNIIKELKDFKEHSDLETKLYARKGFCGFELPKKIQKICGPTLFTGDESNIFGVCCLRSCSDAYIKTMMCPEESKKAGSKKNKQDKKMLSEFSESESDSESSEDSEEEDD